MEILKKRVRNQVREDEKREREIKTRNVEEMEETRRNKIKNKDGGETDKWETKK